jgi:hypothetical protein
MNDDEVEAAAANMEAALGVIEAVNSLADTAASMKGALEERGFSSAVADTTGVQFMFMLMAMNPPKPEKKR